MALHNSNVLALLNTYNAGKIADNTSRQARAAEDSAAANRYMAAQLEESLQLQQHQAEMQHMMLESVAQHNRQLNAIRAELSEVGFAIEGLSSDIRRQTDIHKQHYDEIKKEKKLKEVLYNFEKYLASCEQDKDKLAAAYGSRKTAEMVGSTGFTTADLSDKSDKKDYDSLMARAEKAWASLAPADHEELASVEKMYFSYHELAALDVAKLLDEAAPLKSRVETQISNLPAAPEKKAWGAPEILNKHPELFNRRSEIIKSAKTYSNLGVAAWSVAIASIIFLFSSFPSRQDQNTYIIQNDTVSIYELPNLTGKPKAKKFVRGDIVGVSTYIPADGKQRPSARVEKVGSHPESHGGWIDATLMSKMPEPQRIFSPVLLLIVAILLALGAIVLTAMRLLLSRRYPLPIHQLRAELLKYDREKTEAEEKYKRELAEYQLKTAQLDQQQQAEIKRVEKLNAEIDAGNKVADKKRNDLKNKHESVLTDLKSRVNQFLNEHRSIQDFLPLLK